jgi:hypothetical protein
MIQAMRMDDSTLSLTAFYWVDQKENSPLRVHSEVLKAVNRFRMSITSTCPTRSKRCWCSSQVQMTLNE